MAPQPSASNSKINHFDTPLSPSLFTPLSEHQSQTPSSFYTGLPILHHHSKDAILRIYASDLAHIPALRPFVPTTTTTPASSSPSNDINGTAGTRDGDTEVEIRGVDIWVTSENLKLGFPAHVPTPGHVTIPYPLILIHALQTANADRPAGVYLQIQCVASDDAGDNVNGHGGNEEDEDITATLIITPSSTTLHEGLPNGPASSSPSDPGVEAGETYNALTACANLHPDVNSDVDQRLGVGDGFMFGNETVDDDGGGGSGDGWVNGSGGGGGGESGSGLPPPVPGSGGWITAENMDTYFDAEGNYMGVGRLAAEGGDGEASEKAEEPLGQGAGIVRRRDEDEGGDEEGKWRRTE